MSVGGVPNPSGWRPRTVAEIRKDLNALAKGEKYKIKTGDTAWNIANALKTDNKKIEEDTARLSAQLLQQMHVADPRMLQVGTMLDIKNYTSDKKAADGIDNKRGAPALGKPFKFAEAKPERYVQDSVNYMKDFMDQDKTTDPKNPDIKPNRTFSAQELSNAYQIRVTNKMMKNLDLDGKGGIDLKEATLGLMMADHSNDAPSSKPDGKVSKEELKNFQSLLETPVKREKELDKLYKESRDSASAETLAKIEAEKQTVYKVNQETLGHISNGVDYRGKLTEAVNEVYEKPRFQ